MLRILREREHGALQACQLSQACSKNFLGKLKLERELEGHSGCTNTVSFTEDGNVLLSGSDDLSIRFWSWQSGRELHRIHPGHHNNIFQAYALPHSNDSTIVSCAADGQVRVCSLGTSRGNRTCQSTKVGSHAGRAHKLSLLPENPASTFLSTGEDGVVMYFDLRTKRGPVQKLMVSEGRRRPPVELNAVHANPARPWLFAVGGGDPYARIFDVRHMLDSGSTGTAPCPVTKLCPNHLCNKTSEPVHITCVRYNCFGELLATYNDEDIYLFNAAGSGGQQQPVAENSQGGHGHEGKEDAQGKDGDEEDRRASGAQASSSSLVGSGARGGEGGDGGGEGHGSTSCQQRGCQREDCVQQRFSGHRNSQTVKGVNFFGASDEYVISGSDCGHIFIWRKKDGELRKLLKGDAWVVNCLEPHPWQPLVLATSGIENTIKIWSPTSEEVQPMDQEATKRVLDDNAARRQRVARRVVIPPQMLLALLTGRREGRRERREQSREEGTEDGDHEEESSEGEGQDLAEGVMMARLRRLLLQRASGGELTGFEGEASDDSEGDDNGQQGSDDDDDDDDDNDDDDDDDDENPEWNRESGSDGGSRDGIGTESKSQSDGNEGAGSEGGRGGEGSSRETQGDRKRAKPNDDQ